MATSLDELVRSIPNTDFKLTSSILCKRFPHISDAVLFGKDVFPYDFLQSEASLAYRHLPDREAFNNKLYNNESISDEAYACA